MFKPNRWTLHITTRSGLGVAGVADPYAPSFDFGAHFVVDLFNNFTPASRDTSFLDNTVFYGLEYLEAPDDQREFDAAQKPIDSTCLVEHLAFEVAELERDILAGGDLGFEGDSVTHLKSMKDAIDFVQKQEPTQLFLVAYLDA